MALMTSCFIGTNKNAGKSTAFRFVIDKISKDKSFLEDHQQMVLSSIGLNGESSDNFSGDRKPEIFIPQNQYFVTASHHLKKKMGLYKVIHIFNTPNFSKPFIFGKALTEFSLILEGPNSKNEIVSMKKIISEQLKSCHLFLDGSIDRQMTAHPEISDQLFFSILWTDKKEQINKVKSHLSALKLAVSSDKTRERIKKYNAKTLKSCLWKKSEPDPIYTGSTIPFMDEELFLKLKESSLEDTFLYINGAFTESLAQKLNSLKNNKLNVILDNFTYYFREFKNTMGSKQHFNVEILNTIPIKAFFIKTDFNQSLPSELSHTEAQIIDLFKEVPDEIRI